RDALRVGRLGRLSRGNVRQQSRFHRLLGARVTALAHTRALADAIPQVVELRPAHVASGRELDALDLGRVHGEGALDANPEGLLADGESLARPMPLALDHDPLEHLHAAPRSLDHLEMHLHAVAWRESGNTAQLRALDGFDDAAHGDEGGRVWWARRPEAEFSLGEVQW